MKNFYLVILIFLFSCTSYRNESLLANPNRKKEIILSGKKLYINGHILNFNIDTVYFFQQPYSDQILAAAPVINDSFKIEIDSSLILGQFDIYGLGYKNKESKIKSFEFFNHVRTTPKQGYYINSFLIDTNNIYISGDKQKELGLFISSGKTNESYFRIQMILFGDLDNDSTKRLHEIETYLSIIKEFPKSEYLLNELYLNRAVLNKKELLIFLKAFEKSIFKSEVGKMMLDYLEKKSDKSIIFDMQLDDNNGRNLNILDTSGTLNMFVVWASWCGPCRDEINHLKKLYDEFNSRGLTITSISIDEDLTSWKQALNYERMPWKQFIVSKSKMALFNKTYEVESIPHVIFFDNKKNVITHSIGFEVNQYNEYKKIINKFIH